MNDLRPFATNPSFQKSPAAPLAALHLATLHRQQNQPAEAEKVLAEARKRHDADPEVGPLLKYHHAVAVAEAGKPADARKLFEEVVRQAKGTPVAAEAALRSGQSRVAEGKKLIEDGQKARGQAGNDQAKVQQADKLIEQGRSAIREAAEQLARRGDEFKEKLPAAEARSRMYYDAAWALRSADPKAEGAAAAYKRLIGEFPDAALAVDARFELGELRAEQGNHDEAVKLLKEALDKEPTDKPVSPDTTERVRLRLGACLVAKKDFAGAASQFEAVAGNPKSPYLAQALYRSGDALLAAGEFAKAAEKLAPFRDNGELHNVGGVSDRAVLRLGQALAGAKDFDKSRQAFEVFLQRYGNSPLAPDARYGVGWALQNRSKYDEAVASYQQVTAATTAEVAAKAQLGIGHCRLAQKKYMEAAAAFLVVPYTYEAYPELGYAASLEAARAFADGGQPDQAEQTLRKVLKDAPKDSEWAKAAQERLEKLKK
jgi:TolA-binding protein